jgi:hypothetical protein
MAINSGGAAGVEKMEPEQVLEILRERISKSYGMYQRGNVCGFYRGFGDCYDNSLMIIEYSYLEDFARFIDNFPTAKIFEMIWKAGNIDCKKTKIEAGNAYN